MDASLGQAPDVTADSIRKLLSEGQHGAHAAAAATRADRRRFCGCTGTVAGALLCYTVDDCSYPQPALTTQQAWRFFTHGHLSPLI